ncbi:MAG: Rpp14/Pop5 family protein [Candidatus Diapherotrites archaeon]
MKPLKKSLNAIPLSLRDRKRYIVFELISDKKLSGKELNFSLNKLFLQLYGEIGFSKMNLSLIKFNEENGKGILRCRHSFLEEAKAGIMFLSNKANEIKLIPRIVRVTGTARKAKELIA